MRLQTFVVCLCLLVWNDSHAVQAAIIAADDFQSYGANVQVESNAGVGLNNGTGFSTAWDVSNTFRTQLTVADRTALPLVYSGTNIAIDGGSRALQISGNANGSPVVFRQFAAQPALTTIYFSFLFRTNQILDEGSTRDFIQIGLDDTGAATPNLSVIDQNGTGNDQNFAARSSSGNNHVNSGSPVNPSTTYFIVGKAWVSGVSANYNRVSLFVDPDSLSEPGVATAVSEGDAGISIVDRFSIRTVELDTGDIYLLDELRIGTSWADVITPIPEPSTWLVLFSGITILGGWFCRRPG